MISEKFKNMGHLLKMVKSMFLNSLEELEEKINFEKQPSEAQNIAKMV